VGRTFQGTPYSPLQTHENKKTPPHRAGFGRGLVSIPILRSSSRLELLPGPAAAIPQVGADHRLIPAVEGLRFFDDFPGGGCVPFLQGVQGLVNEDKLFAGSNLCRFLQVMFGVRNLTVLQRMSGIV
jgi:hypothetical protein